MTPLDSVPERIELPDVSAVLRRHGPDDLDALQAAIEESRDHLRPWMVWADQTRAETASFLAGADEQWDAGSAYGYVILETTAGEVLGGCGLHRRLGPDALEIGYWRRASVGGRGVVSAAAAALTDVAMAMTGITRVEIHCDEANLRSAAVARRIGFTLARIEPDTVTAPGERGRSMIWVHPAR